MDPLLGYVIPSRIPDDGSSVSLIVAPGSGAVNVHVAQPLAEPPLVIDKAPKSRPKPIIINLGASPPSTAPLNIVFPTTTVAEEPAPPAPTKPKLIPMSIAFGPGTKPVKVVIAGDVRPKVKSMIVHLADNTSKEPVNVVFAPQKPKVFV